MKKKSIVLLLLIIPLVLFANAYQAFRFVSQENRIVQLDRQQRRLVEQNKRHITELSMLRSPERIRSVASQDSRYSEGFPDSVLYILEGNSD